MAELGYNRNSKKCKEKFENVYKYHKRTKEGRGGKSDGKTYRFFDQLQALENNPSNIQIQSPTPSSNSKPQQPLQAQPVTTIVTTMPLAPPLITPTPPPPTIPSQITTTTTPTISLPHTPLNNPTYFPPQPQPSTTTPMAMSIPNPTPPSFPNNIPTDFFNSSSSSTSSEEITTTMEGGNRRKRKRKWKDFFERLMKEVMEKQEELHHRFLEAIEKREKERAAREEAWRMQEMQRINREREILAQERSIAAAKDSAVMAFLQKVAEQQNLSSSLNNNNINIPQQQQPQISQQPQMPQATTPTQVAPPQVLVTPPQVMNTPPPSVQQAGSVIIPQAPPVVVPQQQQLQVQQQVQQQQVQQQGANMEIIKGDNGENVMALGASSSRWPKTEVEALIKLRTSLETKYQENAPKGPLWEEISSLMKKMGYNRNAKRCKEKWENINKYFKKVKESNKKRPEDSKTCPYFHQLDALYREKNKMESGAKPEGITMAPLMVRPEQQWPPQQPQQQQTVTITGPDVTMEDAENERRQRDEEEFYDDNDEDDKDAGDDDDEDDEDETGGNYEVVASKPSTQ